MYLMEDYRENKENHTIGVFTQPSHNTQFLPKKPTLRLIPYLYHPILLLTEIKKYYCNTVIAPKDII